MLMVSIASGVMLRLSRLSRNREMVREKRFHFEAISCKGMRLEAFFASC